jgi:preprotein translocase subunit SecA
MAFAETEYERREGELGADNMRAIERMLMLRTIDSLWVEHLTAMDEMRQGIGLRAYGQTDPLVAYKREAHDMWSQLLENIRHQVTHSIYHVEITQQPAPPPPPRAAPVLANAGNGGSAPAGTTEKRQPVAAGKAQKTGRNEPCPCGSGKKYKKCHGMAA